MTKVRVFPSEKCQTGYLVGGGDAGQAIVFHDRIVALAGKSIVFHTANLPADADALPTAVDGSAIDLIGADSMADLLAAAMDDDVTTDGRVSHTVRTESVGRPDWVDLIDGTATFGLDWNLHKVLSDGRRSYVAIIADETYAPNGTIWDRLIVARWTETADGLGVLRFRGQYGTR